MASDAPKEPVGPNAPPLEQEPEAFVQKTTRQEVAHTMALGLLVTVILGFAIIAVGIIWMIGSFFSSMSQLGESQRNKNSYQYLEGFASYLDYEEIGTVISTESGLLANGDKNGKKSTLYATLPARIEILIQGPESFAIMESKLLSRETMSCEVNEDYLNCIEDAYRVEVRSQREEIISLTVADTLTQSERDTFRAQQEVDRKEEKLKELAPESARIEKLLVAIGYDSVGKIISDETDPDSLLRNYREIVYSGTDSYIELKKNMLNQNWSCGTRIVDSVVKDGDPYELVDCNSDGIRLLLRPSWDGKNLELTAEFLPD